MVAVVAGLAGYGHHVSAGGALEAALDEVVALYDRLGGLVDNDVDSSHAIAFDALDVLGLVQSVRLNVLHAVS